jgi:hypothetical protein
MLSSHEVLHEYLMTTRHCLCSILFRPIVVSYFYYKEPVISVWPSIDFAVCHRWASHSMVFLGRTHFTITRSLRCLKGTFVFRFQEKSPSVTYIYGFCVCKDLPVFSEGMIEMWSDLVWTLKDHRKGFSIWKLLFFLSWFARLLYISCYLMKEKSEREDLIQAIWRSSYPKVLHC